MSNSTKNAITGYYKSPVAQFLVSIKVLYTDVDSGIVDASFRTAVQTKMMSPLPNGSRGGVPTVGTNSVHLSLETLERESEARNAWRCGSVLECSLFRIRATKHLHSHFRFHLENRWKAPTSLLAHNSQIYQSRR
jgi:hypothetical protein